LPFAVHDGAERRLIQGRSIFGPIDHAFHGSTRSQRHRYPRTARILMGPPLTTRGPALNSPTRTPRRLPLDPVLHQAPISQVLRYRIDKLSLRSAATDVDPPTGRVSVYVSGRRRAPSTAHWFHGGKPVERKEQATHPHGALGTTWQRPICT